MEALGIDLKSLLFQLVNFVILLSLLTWLLHKPIAKLLDSRQQEIMDGLENAEKAKQQLAEAEQRQEELLAEADRKAQAMISEVRTQGKELQAKLEADARAKADALFARAEQEMRAEREQFMREMRGELAELVVDTTAKVLGNSKLKNEKQGQIKELVEEVSKL